MKKIVISSLMVFAFLGANAAEFSIDKTHSSVGFKIKHMSVSNVNGKFNDFDAIIDADKGVLNRLEATIKAASVDTNNQKRDEHLKAADFFDTAKNPEITFKMTKFQKDGDDADVYGDLTINGVTKPIKLEYEFGGTAMNRQNKEVMGFSLEGKIKRSDFNFAPNFGSMMLGDEIKIDIDVEAVAK